MAVGNAVFTERKEFKGANHLSLTTREHVAHSANWMSEITPNFATAVDRTARSPARNSRRVSANRALSYHSLTNCSLHPGCNNTILYDTPETSTTKYYKHTGEKYSCNKLNTNDDLQPWL